MIGYFGFRGSGKTLSLVHDMYRRFKANTDLVVFTNTPLLFPEHKGKKLKQHLFNGLLDLESFFAFALTDGDLLLKKETIVLIDEANLVLPSRLFAKLPSFVLSFLAESRKLNTDIFFTTQHPVRVDKILRELTETWIHCRRIIPHLLHMSYEVVLSGEGIPIDYESSMPFFFPRRAYGLYDTHHIVGMSDNLLPQQLKKEEKISSFIQECYE